MHSQTGSGWIWLFDGRTTDAWRGYLKSDLPSGWQIFDGALTRVAEAGDIITKEQFDNFELELEWKISPGGNSGIFFHVQEDSSIAGRRLGKHKIDMKERLVEVYESGPEMQVLDNETHKDGLDPRTSAGANYALHEPVRDVARKPGEWNQVRLIVNGSHVEHWLNGVKLLEYELWSEDWEQRVAKTKFNEMPAYGRAKTGHIALQDHGDWVAYRNIRIRQVKP